jgi:fructose-specific phosphotransferase system component IIB
MQLSKNCSPYAIWIETNGPMGFAEHYTEEKIQKIWIKDLC